MSIRCEHERFDGKQCSNWAIQSTDPPRCLCHLRGIDRKNYFAMLDEMANDPKRILQSELRIVRRFKQSMERTRLIVEILTMLKELNTKPESKPDPGRELTPAEKVAALRKKSV